MANFENEDRLLRPYRGEMVKFASAHDLRRSLGDRLRGARGKSADHYKSAPAFVLGRHKQILRTGRHTKRSGSTSSSFGKVTSRQKCTRVHFQN
jgi:hypothetical protein